MSRARRYVVVNYSSLIPHKFQGIFVVSLPHRTDRRDAMTLAGAVTGLKLSWVDGVKGVDVEDISLPESERSPNRKWLGSKGSWRAHMNALQRYDYSISFSKAEYSYLTTA
jgi:hypothetical protein